jgi:ATP-dependent helicase/nuclease subunit A
VEARRKHSLTEEQKKAVLSDEPLIVLRAGAGSGKTRVLVERYIRLVLEENIAPTRILAATFTEKAAAEMKERVAAEFLAHNRPDLVAQLNAAPICTLHGFCSRLITPHTLRLGLDPAFQVSDEYESRLIQEEVITRLLVSWRKERPSQYDILVKSLDWSGDHNQRRGSSPAERGFTPHFLNLVETVRCAGGAEQPPFMPLIEFEDELRLEAEELLSRLRSVDEKLPNQTQKKVESTCLNLEKIVHLEHLRDPKILPLLEEIVRIPLNVSSKVKDLMEEVKKGLVPRLFDYYYLPYYNQVQSVLNELYVQFIADYRRRKDELGVLDFLDLEEIALRLLRDNPELRPVEKILIDEAQDLNRVQIRLIRLLAENATAFYVGDRQQSIYRFRHAQVELFEHLYRDAKSGALELHENFRSRKSVLDMVNCVFSESSPVEDGRTPLKLIAKLDYPPVLPPENDLVELLVAAGENRQQARRREAEMLAARLSEIVTGGNFKVHDVSVSENDGKPRFVPRDPTWNDVMILVRAATSFEILEQVFQAAGIPLIVQAGHGFWDSLEISDLMALLRALENPADDFSLACLLRSPAVGFNDDDLVELRVVTGEPADEGGSQRLRSLYEGLQAVADESAATASLPRRAASFLKIFQRLWIEKDLLPARRLIENWVELTGLEQYWERVPKGHIQRSNVLKFMRLCDQFAGESLSRLRSLFEEVRVREMHESVSPDPSSGGYAVKAMTVHSAKGMEAPIVALYDLNYSHTGTSKAFAFSPEDDAGAYFCLRKSIAGGEHGSEESYTPTPFRYICDMEKDKSAEEEERIFYVAMTRAREKLILCASATRLESRSGENEGGRFTGWFKFFLEHTAGLNGDAVFDTEKVPDGEISILDKEGIPHKIHLKRFSEGQSSGTAERLEKESVQTPKKTAPSNFPAEASPSIEPIAVVQALRRDTAVYHAPFRAQDEPLPFDESPLSGAEIGIVVHRILQIADLHQPATNWGDLVERQAQFLLHRSPDPAEVSEIVRMVGGFLNSPLAQEARQAIRILREFPFLFELSGRLLRGKLDLAFQTSSGWTLVDFKSDRHPDSLPSQRHREYELQLQAYALAWKTITGFLPEKAALFFLDAARTEFVSLEAENLKGAEEAFQEV